MNNIDLMKYWLKSSNEDYTTMKLLYENGRYTWALFIGHLVIEKLLKGIYAKNSKESPYVLKTHNLLLLCEKCNIELNGEKLKKLQIIMQFNISRQV